MAILNRLNGRVRLQATPSRRAINEYEAWGQGLQQVGQGITRLTDARLGEQRASMKLHIGSESARLENGLKERMGVLQIEAVKNGHSEEAQLAYWHKGVVELRDDVKQMYGADELMHQRSGLLFEQHRVPGELKMRSKSIGARIKGRKNEYGFLQANILNALGKGETTADQALATLFAGVNALRERGSYWGNSSHVSQG